MPQSGGHIFYSKGIHLEIRNMYPELRSHFDALYGFPDGTRREAGWRKIFANAEPVEKPPQISKAAYAPPTGAGTGLVLQSIGCPLCLKSRCQAWL